MVKASSTGGVKPMSIAGRFQRERERCLGMTDAERAFRAQWVKDQELSPNEPRKVPEMYKALHNPIRRAYRAPLDAFQTMITPFVGPERAFNIRWNTGKLLMGAYLAYIATYYFKYNQNSWLSKSGWYVTQSRIAVHEGDPGYPKVSDRTKGADYASRGFKDVTLNL